MRRIIHNTTALAACLSLMAPHLVMAQTAAPAEPAQQEPQPEQTAPSPAPEGEAPAETGPGAATETGAEADATGDAGSAAADEPAADAAAAEGGAADDAAQAADAVAPEPAAPVVEDAAPAPEAPPEAVSEAPAAADAARSRRSETEPGTGDATATGASDPVPAAEPDAAVETTGSATQTEPAQTPAPKAAPQAATSAPDATAGSDSGQAGTGDAGPADTADAASTPAPSGADPAADEGALAKALGETQDRKASGGAAPATSDAAPASTGKVADAKADASPADTATRPPEADAAETDGARDAADASEAPTAAALDDSASAEVTEERVTEENSRSSDEDFATTLREAMTDPQGQADRQPAGTQSADEQSDDDNDGNDLGKALLLGLGGVAVGAMLANNRQVALSSPDRVVVTRPDGSQQLIKDEVALLRQPGSTVATETFDDGSSRTIVTREDGSRVVTIRDADLRVLRRTLIAADGTTTQLIDDTAAAEPVDISSLPAPAPAAPDTAGQLDDDQLREALMRQSGVDRRFTLSQIRNIPQVRALVAPVNIDAITFETGSAAIAPDQARQLSGLGGVIRDSIAQNPQELFLIEGHTDTVGSDAANLALSDRRAESVALALTEYFDVPPENLVVQGYGEQFPKIRQEGDIRENRRASVRRITDLLQTANN